MTGLIAYLSFQSGEDAKSVGKTLIDYAADKRYQGNAVSEEDMLTLTYAIRQFGRAAIFFVLGVLGTVTIHVSFQKWNWFVKTVVIGLILVAFACLTEKLKIYIPSRHYSYEEMMCSVIAVSAGFILVSVISLLFYALRRIFRQAAKAAH